MRIGVVFVICAVVLNACSAAPAVETPAPQEARMQVVESCRANFGVVGDSYAGLPADQLQQLRGCIAQGIGGVENVSGGLVPFEPLPELMPLDAMELAPLPDLTPVQPTKGAAPVSTGCQAGRTVLQGGSGYCIGGAS